MKKLLTAWLIFEVFTYLAFRLPIMAFLSEEDNKKYRKIINAQLDFIGLKLRI